MALGLGVKRWLSARDYALRLSPSGAERDMEVAFVLVDRPQQITPLRTPELPSVRNRRREMRRVQASHADASSSIYAAKYCFIDECYVCLVEVQSRPLQKG